MAVPKFSLFFLFLLIWTVVKCQLSISGGTTGNNYCMSGFENHGSSCYRFMNLKASWADAWTYCQTLGAHPVSIETSEENTFLTDLVVRHITNSSASGNLVQRIWTDGNNFRGIHAWAGSRTPFSFTSWHVGEPYLATADTMFCVMKMGPFWYADTCSHLRNFVCEIEIDGIVIPPPTSTGKPGDKIAVGK